MLSRDAIGGCLQRWQSEDIDLKAYTSQAAAADLEDLRLALGYEQWNLYAVGYSSTIAYLMMRDYGQGLRSVVIDSSVPVTKEMFLREPANMQAALHRFFELCAADQACDDTYPDLENRFYRLASDLDASPKTLAIKNPQSGARYDFLVDGAALVQFVSTAVAISNERFTPELPRAISEAEMGSTTSLANMLGELIPIFEPAVEGMQWLVNCKEALPAAPLDERLASMGGVNEQVAALYAKIYNYYDQTCAVFEQVQYPTTPVEAVSSGVPTLSLTGQLAHWSSAEWARSAAANLDHHTLVDVTGGTSTGIFGASWQTCPLKLVAEFISDPNTPLDASCADDVPSIRWITFQP
jgi:pimeloyl-ACP methyl ester carboxylesterase